MCLDVYRCVDCNIFLIDKKLFLNNIRINQNYSLHGDASQFSELKPGYHFF